MLLCIYKTKVDFAEIIKLSEIIKLVGVSGIAGVSFLNGWNFQSENSPFWISLIIAKSTHFRQQKRPFYMGFRHNNQTVRNNQTGLLKTSDLFVMLNSFQHDSLINLLPTKLLFKIHIPKRILKKTHLRRSFLIFWGQTSKFELLRQQNG